MKRIALYLLFVIRVSSLGAMMHEDPRIYECPSMREVRAILDPHRESPSTIYGFDLDNTVMEPAGILVRNFDPENRFQVGSDQWFTAVLHFVTINGSIFNEKTPIQYTMEFNQIAQFCIRMKPVEPDMIDFINELQEKHIPTIGLTARSYPLKDITLRQLHLQVGAHFDLSCINIRSMIFEPEREEFLRAMLSDAILFCSDNHKGPMLCRFILEAIDGDSKYIPKRVVCIDDKQRHLVDIGRAIDHLNSELAAKAAQEKSLLAEYERCGVPCPYPCLLKDFTPIQFIGIRYGRLDHKVKAYEAEGLFSPVSISFLKEQSASPRFQAECLCQTQ